MLGKDCHMSGSAFRMDSLTQSPPHIPHPPTIRVNKLVRACLDKNNLLATRLLNIMYCRYVHVHSSGRTVLLTVTHSKLHLISIS